MIKISSRELKEFQNEENQLYLIDYSRFKKIMQIAEPSLTEQQINAIFEILDFDKNKILELNEFMNLADLLNIRISEIRDRENLFQKLMPKIYSSKISTIVKRLVRHKLVHFQE
jgi:Ca2+-binding EF-hand superfamily protein